MFDIASADLPAVALPLLAIIGAAVFIAAVMVTRKPGLPPSRDRAEARFNNVQRRLAQAIADREHVKRDLIRARQHDDAFSISIRRGQLQSLNEEIADLQAEYDAAALDALMYLETA